MLNNAQQPVDSNTSPQHDSTANGDAIGGAARKTGATRSNHPSYPKTVQRDLFSVGRIALDGRTPLPTEARRTLADKLEKGILEGTFTPAQARFITHIDGPFLELAGAGSGKTHSVTHRILHLASIGVPLDAILAVTFTKKAATEMKDRCRKYLSLHTRRLPHIRTLHSLGLKIIKRDANLLRLPSDVQVIPAVFADQFLERGLKSLSAAARATIEGDPLPTLAETISRWKNAGIDPAAARDQLAHPLAQAYITYQTWLQETGFIDFDDMIRLPTALFTRTGTEGEQALKYWQGKYQFIMVDEYQDTNQAQEDLLCLLAQRHRNLCVVGDDYQAIYSWRGADVRNILEFSKRWPDCATGKLEENFRSTPNICRCANRLIAHASEHQHVKELRAVKPEGKEPQAWLYPDSYAEAEGIARFIVESGRAPGDFAIIVRDQYRSHPELIEQALAAAEIPYEVWFSDNLKMGPVKRNAYAMLAAIHNPRRNEVAFLQLLEAPAFELTRADYDQLLAIRKSSSSTIWEVMASKNRKGISKQGKNTLSALYNLIEDLHKRARRSGRSEPLAEIAFDGFKALYPDSTVPQLWNDPQTHEVNTISLRTISRNLDSYEKKALPRNRNFSSFLQFQLVEIPRRIKEGQSKKKSNQARTKVAILTMHGSKGLEFPVVILPAFVEGSIPHQRSIDDDYAMSEAGSYIGSDGLPKTAPLDEELRLAFVAVTRAQEQLLITIPQSSRGRSGSQAQTPSRYLSFMGLELVVKSL